MQRCGFDAVVCARSDTAVRVTIGPDGRSWASAENSTRNMRLGRFEVEPLLLFLVFVPVSIGLELFHANPVWIFGSSALAIIPLAGLMGKAIEHLAERLGAGLGVLLNASFGNAAE